MAGFGQLVRAAMTEGTLSVKHKELMALAIQITQPCPGAHRFSCRGAHQLHCTRAELEETRAVCVYGGGGPALKYAAEIIAAWENLSPA